MTNLWKARPADGGDRLRDGGGWSGVRRVGWVKSGVLPVDCNTSGSVTALHNLIEPTFLTQEMPHLRMEN